MGTIRDSNTESAIKSRMRARINTIDSTVDTQQGTPVKDIVIDGPATELRNNYVLEDYVNRIKNVDEFLDILDDDAYLEDMRVALGLTTVAEVKEMIETDLDDFADTFGITRIVSRKALYVQRFYRPDDNSGSTISIPLGTEVKTPDGQVAAVTITTVAQVPIIDATTGLYYVEETVEATTSGTDGNVSLGTLTTMTPQLSQANATSNISLIQAGIDEESNTSLVDRIKEARRGRNYPTESGLERLATGALEDSTLSFVDAIVIGPTHSLMVRAPAGAVDVYVVGKSIVSYEEVIRYDGINDTYVLGLQPVESATAAAGAVTGTLSMTFNSDVTGGFAGSTRAQNSITIDDTSPLVTGEAITVSYTYDAAIRNAQDLVSDGGQFHAPAMDLLFRQAIQVSISIDLEVVQFGDRSQSDVQTDVEADLTAFLNGGTTSNNVLYSAKTIGEDIDRSDVIALVAAIDDVDRITLTGTKAIVFEVDGVATEESPIPVADNEYARLGTVTFL